MKQICQNFPVVLSWIATLILVCSSNVQAQIGGPVYGPAVTISGPDQACSGSAQTYYAEVTGGSCYAYYWSVSGGTYSGSGSQITVNWTGSSGSVSVYVTQCYDDYGDYTSDADDYMMVSVGTAPAGSTRFNYIEAGTISSCGATYTNTKNNEPGSCFGNSYGQASDDIFYRFTLQSAAEVSISTCGSGLWDTYLHLLDVNGNWIANNDDNGVLCSGMQASLKRNLAAGTYFVVAEGYGTSNGLITTTISTGSAPVTLTPANPETAPGQPVTLTASGTSADTYSWSPATGLSATSGMSVTASPTMTTTYTVTRTTGGGCTSTASVTVTVAQSMNHIIATTLQDAYTTMPNLQSLPKEKWQQQITYFDGLGRPVQQVQRHASPTGKDIVTPVVYDPMGREHKKYLPYVSTGNSGFYQADALSRQQAFYGVAGDKVADDTAPFAQTLFEDSPLNRVLEQGAPGSTWQPSNGRTIKLSERTNEANEARLWEVDGNGVVTTPGFYTAGELYVSQTWDEHDALVVEYKDKQGRVVMKKVQENGTVTATSDAGFMVTQYVYTKWGQLKMVIQPEGSKQVPASGAWSTAWVQNFIFNWCFTYDYDGLGRLYRKKVPGSGYVKVINNQRDLPVLTQDAVQESRNEWTFTKYDALNRPVITGTLTTTKSYAQLQNELDAAGETVFFETRENSSVGYTLNNSYPRSLGEADLLSITYYDDYSYAALNSTYAFTGDAAKQAAAVRGQVTGTKVRRMEGATKGTWLVSATYYDRDYRPLESISDSHLGGVDRTVSAYDFTGKVTQTTLTHRFGTPAARTVANKFNYDHIGRLLNSWQSTGGEDTVLLSKAEYNELGQLIDKKLHSTDNGFNFLQSVDYRYNIRGWMTSINNATLSQDSKNDETDDMFGLELSYEKDMKIWGGPQFNGNISEMVWRSITDNTQRGYSYGYDIASRLTNASYYTAATNGENYSVEMFSRDASGNPVAGSGYDSNGNIKSMSRRSITGGDIYGHASQKTYGEVDRLSYYYEGNRLVGVDDASGEVGPAGDFRDNGNKYWASNVIEYEYDANGNLKKDKNKGISDVFYNHLNLPYRLEMGSASNRIEYTYTASGAKLQKRVYQNNALTATTDYAGGFVYENNTPVFAHTAEGRVLFQPNNTYAWKYEYHIKDHLGNLRLNFKDGDINSQLLTMEQVNAQEEEKEFERVPQSRRRDRLHARTGEHAARLNARQGLLLGPSKRLEVKRGDKLEVEVFGHYQQQVKDNWLYTAAAFLLGNASMRGTGQVPQDGLNQTSKSRFPLLAIGIAFTPQVKQRLKGVPAAYVKYIAYDTAGVYLGSEYRLITREAQNNWQQLKLEHKAQQDGYVEVFLANESGEDVYFDDMMISSTPLDVQENHYDPWGLNLAGIERQGAPDHKFQYNGKEKQTELGLNWMDYGFRNYDAQIGRWHSIDPLAEKRYWMSPYNFVQNNPINRFDPNGLTDFTLNKKTGEVKEVAGTETDEGPDRIVKTKRNGEVKTKKNGDARVAIDKIEKGILKDGQNFKEKNNMIQVGGEGQPTVEGVESFALELSSYVGKEIAGAYFSNDGSKDATFISIGMYKNNSNTESNENGAILGYKDNFILNGFFHTHPSNTKADPFSPSQADRDHRDDVFRASKDPYNTILVHPNLRFYILTKPINYGDKSPARVEYTNY